MTEGTARRMLMLHYGAEPSPKGIAAETKDERVFLDTGAGRTLLEDEASRTGIYTC